MSFKVPVIPPKPDGVRGIHTSRIATPTGEAITPAGARPGERASPCRRERREAGRAGPTPRAGVNRRRSGTRRVVSSLTVRDFRLTFEFRLPPQIMSSRVSRLSSTSGNASSSARGKECPRCGETVKQTARVCRYCQYRFEQGWIPQIGKVWAIIGSVVAVIGTGVGIWVAFRGDGDSSDPAAQVRSCMSQHGLDKARTETETGDTRIFASCQWPAPEYADQDGFYEIRVRLVSRSQFLDAGDTSEASGVGFADRIKIGDCEEARAEYSFGSQGDFSPLDPLLLERGDVVTVDGQPWSNKPGKGVFLGFYPAADEVVVLHNSKNGLDSVRCVS